MKGLYLLAVGAALAALSSPAFAQTGNWSDGLYVRGDVGAAFGSQSTESDTDPGAVNASLGPVQIAGNTGTAFLGDVGVGYRLAPFFRVEATYLHLASATFQGSTVPAFGSARATVSADIGLASAYLDLDPWTAPILAGMDPMLGKFQPFLVGGVGATVNHNGTETDSVGGVESDTFAGADHTDLAWMLGAGIGYPVGNGVVIDLMYRYIDLGHRFTGSTLRLTNGATFTETADTADLQAHVVTVGVRWNF